MSFERLKFLELTIVDFNSSIGWNDTESSVNIKLAPDPENNETTIGTYELGKNYEFKLKQDNPFVFNGFLDRVIEKHDTGGTFYEVKLNDGKELIKNVEIITSSLYGTSDIKEDSPIINMFNVFRWWESKGFGSSQANESGMPYSKLEEGINYLSKKYGIISAEVRYSIKLDFATKVPKFYRIEGPYINLMDLISKICDDLGLLFKITLTGTEFTVQTTSLGVDPANQKVQNVIKDLAKDRNVISWDAGVESSNNIESNFMLWGGLKEHSICFNNDVSLAQMNVVVGTPVNYDQYYYGNADGPNSRIKQFWGYDINGEAYWSSASYDVVKCACPYYNYRFNSLRPSISSHSTMKANAWGIPLVGMESILPGPAYEMTMDELLLITGGNQDNWALYLEILDDAFYSDNIYTTVFLRAPRTNISMVANFMAGGGSTEFPLKREFSEKDNDIGVIRGAQLFTYLKSVIDSYYGKQFLVEVNYKGDLNYNTVDYGQNKPDSKSDGLLIKQVLENYTSSDSLDLNIKQNQPKKIYNILPTDSGWIDPAILEAKTNPSLPREMLNAMALNQDGKMQNWLIFNLPNSWETQFTYDSSSSDTISYSDSGSQYLWVKASVNEQYVTIPIAQNALIKTTVHSEVVGLGTVGTWISTQYIGVDKKDSEHVLVSIGQSVAAFNRLIHNQFGVDALVTCYFGLQYRNQVIGQSENFKTGLPALYPFQAILNFKSTRNDFYGPWYFGNTKGGKTKIEQNNDLVPWQFNASGTLEEAAKNRLKDINPVPYFETGSLNKIGLPEHNLGDEIVKNGPIVTSINTSYGPSGVTTQYSFRTFTPKFGMPSRYNTERLKKSAIKAYSDRKNILFVYMESIKKAQSLQRSFAGAKIQNFVLNYLGRRYDRNTPHQNIVLAQTIDPMADKGGTVRRKTIGGSHSNIESAGAMAIQSGDYRNKGAVSYDGLFSPFNNFGSQSLLNTVTSIPYGSFLSAPEGLPTAYTYNPYRYTDPVQGDWKFPSGRPPAVHSFHGDGGYIYDNYHAADFLESSGNVLNGNKEAIYVHSRYGPRNVIKCQPVGLRGPIMVVGYGNSYMDYDLLTDSNGNLVTIKNRYDEVVGVPIPKVLPNSVAYATGEGLAGPVDLMWDKYRGVWTSHDIATGFAVSNIRPFDDGYVYLNMNGNRSSQQILIKNFSARKIYANQSVLLCYSANDGRWIIKGEQVKIKFDGQASDCPVAANPLTPTTTTTKANSSDFKTVLTYDECESTEVMWFVNTNGFTGDQAVLVTKEGSITTLKFKNGLLKDIVPVTIDPNNTTTTAPTTTIEPTTTTPAPTYYMNPVVDQPDCYQCSGNDIDAVEQFATLALCEAAKPLYNTACKVLLYFDGICWLCEDDADGQYTGPNKHADCKVDQDANNALVEGCNDCYLIQYVHTVGEECYRCGQELPSGTDTLTATYSGSDACQKCADVLDAYNVHCATTTTTTECPDYWLNKNADNECHYCSTSVDGSSQGPYTGCDAPNDCEDARSAQDAGLGDYCTTTTEAPTTTASPTSTTEGPTTTANPNAGCLRVLVGVTCDADGELVPEYDYAVKCATTMPPPPQSGLPTSIQIKLLSAQVQSLTGQLSNLYNMLELYGIKTLGDK